MLPNILRNKDNQAMKFGQLVADHLLLIFITDFQKTKRGLELVSLPHAMDDFCRKIFVLLNSIN